MMRAFYRPRTRPASHDLSKPPPITLIAGPTASGKSALALKMARETGAVIINADSQQLYADLRILTARPSAEDEGQADHRLYGVADAADAWSVGRWSRAVMALLDDLRDQSRPAIVVGGTGLYFTALTRGLADIPEISLAAREATQADYLNQGEDGFRQRLNSVDPISASLIAVGDHQRLVRAMSVYTQTGRTLTEWKKNTRPLLPIGEWTSLVVEPDRSQLYNACNQRVDRMMNDGVLAEVAALAAKEHPHSLPVTKAVGYRELASYVSGELSRAEAVDAVKQATRNYAKRQLTWTRGQMRNWPRHACSRTAFPLLQSLHARIDCRDNQG
jgi:tRNA dimethylallyltransferase